MSDQKPNVRLRYLYRPVSGASVFGGSLTSAIKSKEAVVRLRANGYPDAEVERVLELPNNARRYWRWRNNKWSTKFWEDPSKEDLAYWS